MSRENLSKAVYDALRRSIVLVLTSSTLVNSCRRTCTYRLTVFPSGLGERLRIIHYWNYPEALRTASAVLDTFPYGGCLTFLEVKHFCA